MRSYDGNVITWWCQSFPLVDGQRRLPSKLGVGCLRSRTSISPDKKNCRQKNDRREQSPIYPLLLHTIATHYPTKKTPARPRLEHVGQNKDEPVRLLFATVRVRRVRQRLRLLIAADYVNLARGCMNLTGWGKGETFRCAPDFVSSVSPVDDPTPTDESVQLVDGSYPGPYRQPHLCSTLENTDACGGSRADSGATSA